jgi:NAD(P)-dependent dehydrogenase (short-subunit alcohol dehydrogenase family)
MKLTGRVALITGARQGIGAAISVATGRITLPGGAAGWSARRA